MLATRRQAVTFTSSYGQLDTTSTDTPLVGDTGFKTPLATNYNSIEAAILLDVYFVV